MKNPRTRAKAPALITAAVLLLTLLLTACGPAAIMAQHDNLYDNDTLLATQNKYAVVSFTGNTREGSGYTFTAGTLSGAYPLWQHTTLGGEEITLTGTVAETKGGDVKLVLIAPDNTVTTLAEAAGNAPNSFTHTFATEAGTYKVKLVGKNGAGAEGYLEEVSDPVGTFAPQ